VVGMLATAWWHGLLTTLPPPPLDAPMPLGPRQVYETALNVCSVALVVCLIRGARATRLMAGGLFLGWVVLTVSQPPEGPVLVLSVLPLTTLAVPLLAAVLAPTEPVVPWPRWLLLLPVFVLGGWVVSLHPARPIGWLTVLTDPAGLELAAVVTAGVIVLARRSTSSAARLAVAGLGLAVLPSLASRLSFEGLPGYRETIIAGLVLLAGTVIATGVMGARAVQRLPTGVSGDTIADHGEGHD
jgi:hypothetical protein